MTEAIALFVGHLFAAGEVERIEALAHADNVGSRRLLEPCGVTFEGTLRRAHFDRGTATISPCTRSYARKRNRRTRCSLLWEARSLRGAGRTARRASGRPGARRHSALRQPSRPA